MAVGSSCHFENNDDDNDNNHHHHHDSNSNPRFNASVSTITGGSGSIAHGFDGGFYRGQIVVSGWKSRSWKEIFGHRIAKSRNQCPELSQDETFVRETTQTRMGGRISGIGI
jgi:hypothetical protein